jgi:(E)-4-hydroxy-3-methylbut-2-enyl-diphosphate synthase
MNIERRKTRQILIGNVPVGDGAPIAVQSMTNTDTRNTRATIRQIRRLEDSGCEIIRLGVPDIRSARPRAKKKIQIPLVADIHFDYRLALEALRQGVDGLRLNPGNIGAQHKVREVTKAASERSVPIRIGVNAGSLQKELLAKYGGATPEAMVESALSI